MHATLTDIKEELALAVDALSLLMDHLWDSKEADARIRSQAEEWSIKRHRAGLTYGHSGGGKGSEEWL
jgi:hypothetical protein